jgi:hypothetical protein
MEIGTIDYIEPKIFFIVPYRDRERHLELYLNHMEHVLEGLDYLTLIVHQDDKRYFNRGAMKNIGFKFLKENFPKTYKEKTLVFHDVDHVVWKKGVLDFNTVPGLVKHHFGFPENFVKSLGGIISMNAGDFEKTNGFPNYWSWGYEDNCLYYRAKNAGLKIDESKLKPPKHPDIIMFWHGQKKLINENYIWRNFSNDNGFGIKEVVNLSYKLSDYNDRKRLVVINVENFAVPGVYPLLKKKTPALSFETASRGNIYKKLFKGR